MVHQELVFLVVAEMLTIVDPLDLPITNTLRLVFLDLCALIVHQLVNFLGQFILHIPDLRLGLLSCPLLDFFVSF